MLACLCLALAVGACGDGSYAAAVRRAWIPVCLCAVMALGACGDDDGGGGDGGGGDGGGGDGGGGDAGAPETTAGRGESSGGCRDVKAPPAKPDGGQRKPTARLDPSKTYDVRFETSCGSFTVRLDVRTSPKTSASFVALARRGFFDDTVFHRIVPGFVIQGGDPTGTGTGGPGYKVKAEFNPRSHKRGVLSMARTNDPNSAGSQFFLMHQDSPFLDNQYTAFGKATSGLDVVDKLANQPRDRNDRPHNPAKINRITIEER